MIFFLTLKRELSEGGLVVVTMVIDEETGVVLYGPQLTSKGFIFDSATGHLIDDAQCVILEIVEEMDPETEFKTAVLTKKTSKSFETIFFLYHKPQTLDCTGDN